MPQQHILALDIDKTLIFSGHIPDWVIEEMNYIEFDPDLMQHFARMTHPDGVEPFYDNYYAIFPEAWRKIISATLAAGHIVVFITHGMHLPEILIPVLAHLYQIDVQILQKCIFINPLTYPGISSKAMKLKLAIAANKLPDLPAVFVDDQLFVGSDCKLVDERYRFIKATGHVTNDENDGVVPTDNKFLGDIIAALGLDLTLTAEDTNFSNFPSTHFLQHGIVKAARKEHYLLDVYAYRIMGLTTEEKLLLLEYIFLSAPLTDETCEGICTFAWLAKIPIMYAAMFAMNESYDSKFRFLRICMLFVSKVSYLSGDQAYALDLFIYLNEQLELQRQFIEHGSELDAFLSAVGSNNKNYDHSGTAYQYDPSAFLMSRLAKNVNVLLKIVQHCAAYLSQHRVAVEIIAANISAIMENEPETDFCKQEIAPLYEALKRSMEQRWFTRYCCFEKVLVDRIDEIRTEMLNKQQNRLSIYTNNHASARLTQ